LFIRDLPRLSVDIDLTYLPIESRQDSLSNISDAIIRIANDIERGIPSTKVQFARPDAQVAKAVVQTPSVRIKLEPNLIIRGHIFATQTLDLCATGQTDFEQFCQARLLSTAEIYGGKLCAALDRQDPRDLFDVKMLLDEGPLDKSLRRAFVIMLASHNRPMNEVLSSPVKDLAAPYENSFRGMTRDLVPLSDLYDAHERLKNILPSSLDDAERQFLISLKEGNPEWGLLELPQVQELPAIQWKLQNIRMMDPAKRIEALRNLEKVLAR
jgi:predicted nucleotidyltransferase component of viral defense system